jgi:Trypsin
MITNVGLCSANLLKKKWVITAGRCVLGVTSGDVYFGHPRKGHADVKHNTFKHFVMHPSFNGAGSFDMALVKLDKDFEFTINLYPIVLPDSELDKSEIPLEII